MKGAGGAASKAHKTHSGQFSPAVRPTVGCMHGVLVHHQRRHTARLGPLWHTHAVPSLGRWRVGCCSKEVSANAMALTSTRSDFLISREQQILKEWLCIAIPPHPTALVRLASRSPALHAAETPEEGAAQAKVPPLPWRQGAADQEAAPRGQRPDAGWGRGWGRRAPSKG